MSLHDAMRDACRHVGIAVPQRLRPGQWAKSPVIGKAASNTSGRVLVFDDQRGGICYNWATGQQIRFSIDAQSDASAPRPRDVARERRQEADRVDVAKICVEIVRSCAQAPHPYLAAKGFPDALGLVHEAPWRHFPHGALGEALTRAMPAGDGPRLIVPGRIGGQITTVQFIGPDGAKKNILHGMMGGTSHRVATGRETWVCEGIATALSIRAALRFLGRSATVLSAFSASNAAKVASAIPGAIIAADHDKPVEAFGGLGTGEYYARKAGGPWVMPPMLEDFNDMHQRLGLRAVAMLLREVG